MAELLNVDIAVANSDGCADHVAVFEAGAKEDGSRDAVVFASWRAYVAPRMRNQRTHGVAAQERPLVALVWNGSSHYDAGVPVQATG